MLLFRLNVTRRKTWAALLLALWPALVPAQSNDADFPTPVRESFVEGRIEARDLGDARLTRHFYIFNGAPGDLTVKVESANLEGDVDIFTAEGLRPVLKIGLYSGGGASFINKTAYLKRSAPLILRIEARTPDDQTGTYKITFSGAFAVYGGPDIAAPPAPLATPSANASPAVRVNSAGARIDPPPAQPTPAPTPMETVAAAKPPAKPEGRARIPKPAPTPKPEAATTTPEGETAKVTPPAPAPKKPTRPRPAKPKPETKPADTTTAPLPAEEIAAAPPAPKPKPAAKSKAKKTPPAAPPVIENPPATETATAAPALPKPKPAAKAKPPVAQTQLTLELKDGTRIERANARKVTIEKGVVVVITAEGKIERYSLLDIAQMSVEPIIIQP